MDVLQDTRIQKIITNLKYKAMKELTYSDQINIDTFKQIIRCLGNDIEDVKKGKTAPSQKIIMIFKLSQQRADLLLNAKKNYPNIKWTEFVKNSSIVIDREIAYNAIKENKGLN